MSLGIDIAKATAHEIHDLLISGQISSEEITTAQIQRINETDPIIEAYLERTGETALETARIVDKRIRNGEKTSVLEGVPMAFKDNLCTIGVKTTCASKMLENFVPPYDAFVVKRIKEHNAPVLGKVNMDEFAMGSSTETSYFKKTKNPYDITKVPGGSSGGSAAAVSAGLAVYSLGSDTGGSIRQPASYCGVVGLKPTYGLVSRYGCVAFASSFDQIGPLTKDVTDCAHVLNAVAGHDPKDSTSLKTPATDYSAALVNNVKGLKIGIAEDYLGEGVNADVKQAVLQAADTLKSLGAEVDSYTSDVTKYGIPAYYIMSAAEASANLARFDGIRYGYRADNYSTLNQLYENTRSEGFGAEVKRRILVGTFALSSGYYDAYYKKALKVRTLICNDYKTRFDKFDLLLTPTATTTAFKFGSISTPVEMYLNDLCTVSANIAGLPAISVPCGLDSEGMPIGLQLIAPPLSEEVLLRTAYTFEQNTDFHKNAPAFKNSEVKV